MGVPAFYRWLAEKYPVVLVEVIEEEPVVIDGVEVPVDTSKKNLNDIEYDNLFLVMNGIIHPCFHPEDRPSPTTYDEVFQCMFDYIDRIFVMVRPRKLLFMAIDGVAPRAKMSQQRSRRFRAAKDAAGVTKLEEPGWKERYYEENFLLKLLRKLSYTERRCLEIGLRWVMHYYREGVCSWQWFYPYHYASLASDLKGLSKLNINFELGTPFKPFDQLLGVFPAARAHALPQPYRKLMTDPNSPIIDFYPSDFEVDMNGKRYAWQGVAKLPFIEEAGLLAEVWKIEHLLTAEETRRNIVMFELLFVNSCRPLSACICTLDNKGRNMLDKDRIEVKEPINPKESGGMNGYISLYVGEPCPPIFRSPVAGMEILDNLVICGIYGLPDKHRQITRPPNGVKYHKKIVTVGDLKAEPVLWHEDFGRRNSETGRQNPPGSISSRQLGEAAHRFPANSLQVKVQSNGHEHIINGQHRPYVVTMCPPQSLLPDTMQVSHAGYHSACRPMSAPLPPRGAWLLSPYASIPTQQYGYTQPCPRPSIYNSHHQSNSYRRNNYECPRSHHYGGNTYSHHVSGHVNYLPDMSASTDVNVWPYI
ncbi:5'-3' exoribonuclease 3-like [Neltuma alba]|uniref:5'-3' exoribonuclease 3-like n=1 Tax=Neltuma alba TaxID=207710 RepID=UPI0010A3E67F|nr:5'-3' exoribonuclease 3-like [Prosopis alba]